MDRELEEVIAGSPFVVLPGTYWMHRAGQHASAPVDRETMWGAIDDGFERTVVRCAGDRPPDMDDDGYGPLRGIRLQVAKPFAAPGFLAAACTAIAGAKVSVLVISTFSFDYVFVRATCLEQAREALTERGFPEAEG